MSELTPAQIREHRAEMLVSLTGMRAMHANEARTYLDLADRIAGGKDCACDAHAC